MDEQVILEGDPPIALVLRPSARAQRLSLRVSRLDGRVTLSLPRGASRRHALAFAAEKADWIRRQLAQQPDAARLMPGGTVPVHGRERQIVTHAGRDVRLLGDTVAVPDRDVARTPARLRALLKTHARDALVEAVTRHAATIGRAPGRISLRDPRSRWGSCSSKGDLMFSWRLVMAPPEVLDYVAAHEVAHLEEMNHSPAFWAVVARICPGYPARRRWLTEHAAGLHRYRFDD